MKDNYDLNNKLYKIRYFYNTKSCKSLLKDITLWLEINNPYIHNVSIGTTWDTDTKNNDWVADITYMEIPQNG